MQASGVGDPAFVDKIDAVAAMILNSDGGKQWWLDVGPHFVHFAYVQEYMANQGKDLPKLTDLVPWERDLS